MEIGFFIVSLSSLVFDFECHVVQNGLEVLKVLHNASKIEGSSSLDFNNG
jgi:hypothetical protein